MASVIVAMALGKLVLGVALVLNLNDYWKYSGGKGVAGNDAVVESCSNPSSDDCFAYCGSVFVVEVNVQDDDFKFDDASVPPNLVTVSHDIAADYCIAEFPGYCAYNYWLV